MTISSQAPAVCVPTFCPWKQKGTAKINQGLAFIDFLKKNTIIANRPQILGKPLACELCFGTLVLKIVVLHHKTCVFFLYKG